MSLSDDADIKYQRALIYYQRKNFKKALSDFLSVKLSTEFSTKPALYNYIGMCEGQLGNSRESIQGHLKALELDCNFKEAKLNYGQMMKDTGQFEKAGTCLYIYFIFIFLYYLLSLNYFVFL